MVDGESSVTVVRSTRASSHQGSAVKPRVPGLVMTISVVRSATRTPRCLLLSIARREVFWRAMVKSVGLDLLPMLRWNRRTNINFDVELLGRRRRALERWLVRLKRSHTRV